MTHRCGIAADGKTGDGCGLLLQMPDGFMRALAREAGDTELTDSYAVGSVMLNTDNALAERARRVITKEIAEQRACLDGWRTVPVNTGFLPPNALAARPVVEHFYFNNTP